MLECFDDAFTFVNVLLLSSSAFNERILSLHTQLLSFYFEIKLFIHIIIARECHIHRRYGNIFTVLDSRHIMFVSAVFILSLILFHSLVVGKAHSFMYVYIRPSHVAIIETIDKVIVRREH